MSIAMKAFQDANLQGWSLNVWTFCAHSDGITADTDAISKAITAANNGSRLSGKPISVH